MGPQQRAIIFKVDLLPCHFQRYLSLFYYSNLLVQYSICLISRLQYMTCFLSPIQVQVPTYRKQVYLHAVRFNCIAHVCSIRIGRVLLMAYCRRIACGHKGSCLVQPLASSIKDLRLSRNPLDKGGSPTLHSPYKLKETQGPAPLPVPPGAENSPRCGPAPRQSDSRSGIPLGTWS